MRPKTAPARQALVEFALLIVVLFLLMAGTVDVARVVTAYTYLNNAAQEGAFYAALHPTDTTGITTRVRDTLKSMFADPNSVMVQVQYQSQPCPGHYVTVEVESELVLIFPLTELFLPNRRIPLHTLAQQLILKSEAPGCP